MTQEVTGTRPDTVENKTMGLKGQIKRLMPQAMLERIQAYRYPDAHRWGEQSADWYDKSFEEGATYSRHYTKSDHYPIWTVLIDRVRKCGPAKVLEIACGTGQLARALQDHGFLSDYCGLDFSPKRIEHARIQNADLRFEIADVFETDLLETFSYNTVITTEFLEHVERDLDVIGRIRAGTTILATVPNYPWTSHVRHFDTAEQVMERYSPLISGLDVFPILRLESNKIIYVMEGKKI